ncbi:MAG: electron transfer flavoprotein subunit beta/FixA family protein [Candidatus Tyrphobacter sp.]
MRIVVTVKLVPDLNAPKRIDAATKRLVRGGVETVLNPYDEYALEAGLQLKERLGGDTTVSVLSLVPESSKEILRKALAMGADDAVVVSDPLLEGSDVAMTARVLALALKKSGFDLVICGGLTDDGATGGVPGAIAEHLGVPALTNARKIDVENGALHAQRETDTGYQVITAPLPALASVTMAIGEPRYASLKGIMNAKKKPLLVLSATDVGAADLKPKTELLRFEPPPARTKARVVEAPDGATGARAIVDFLKERKLV